MEHVMENGNGQNGCAHVAHEKAARCRMTLDFDPLSFHLDIGGEFPNLDCALAMLEQAKRAIEAEQRKANALQLQSQITQQRQEQAIAARVRNGR